MKFHRLVALIAAFILPAVGVRTALAHANLVHCSIHNNQTFRASHVPKTVTATFAEDLVPGATRSWMAVFEGEADHGLVTEKEHSVVSFKNPKQMVLRLPRLRPERYYLIWYTQSAIDHHIAAGIVYFRVK